MRNPTTSATGALLGYQEPQMLLLGAVSGAVFGGLAGHLGAQWTNSKKPGNWVGVGATSMGLLTAHAGGSCSGSLDCIGAIIPGLAGVFVLLPLAGITAVVKGASDDKKGFTTGQKVMAGLGGASVLGFLYLRKQNEIRQERSLRHNEAQRRRMEMHAKNPNTAPDIQPLPATQGFW